MADRQGWAGLVSACEVVGPAVAQRLAADGWTVGRPEAEDRRSGTEGERGDAVLVVVAPPLRYVNPAGDFGDEEAAGLAGIKATGEAALVRSAGSRPGAMVLVAGAGSRTGEPGAVGASATGGLVALGQSWARRAGVTGVRVNVVVPGAVDRGDGVALGAPDRNWSRRVARAAPIRRLVRAEEVAAAVTFLSSPAASYVNGVVLSVDGGLAMGT